MGRLVDTVATVTMKGYEKKKKGNHGFPLPKKWETLITISEIFFWDKSFGTMGL